MRQRALSLLGSLVVVLGALCWIVADSTGVEASFHEAATAANVETSRYVAADPLANYTFVAPPNAANGQPVRLMVALHGMGGSGADMAAMLGAQATAQGFALLAPTMPYRDYLDPEQVRRDGELLPRLRALIDSLSAKTGVQFKPGVVMFGFSRGSQEALRFSLMFPDYTIGVAGLSAGSYTLPASTYSDGRAMKYPFGTSDVDAICGQKFDAVATRQVAYWIGVGGADNNSKDVPRQWDTLVGTTRLERAQRYVEILQAFGAKASFQMFPNAGHEVTDAMRDGAIKFLADVSAAH